MSYNLSSLLPKCHKKPILSFKKLRKHLPLILIPILFILSISLYIFMPKNNKYISHLSENQVETPSVVSDHSYGSVLDKTNQYFSKQVINDYHRLSSNFIKLKALHINGKPLLLPSGEDQNSTVRTQRLFVKEMMKHSWDSYVKYAWGYNELRPISKIPYTQEIFGGDHQLGASIVDSLSTLYIMNMTEEFQTGRNWVQNNFDLSLVNSEMSVFETVIRFVGGLLSAFAFTNDQMFLQKAKHVADRMLPAFETTTGIPLNVINPSNGNARNHGFIAWFTGGSSSLAALGTLHLEFVYLSAVTGDNKYAEKVHKIRNFMEKIRKPYEGLYLNSIDPYSGHWEEDIVNIGGGGDSYYEYLIKSWIQSNRTDIQSLRMYESAIHAINKSLVQKSRSGLTYLAKQINGKLEHSMDHLTCFAGGMFSLGALELMGKHKKEYYFRLGANITDTCYESYRRTATNIGPEKFKFNSREEAVALNNYEMYYILRPEVIESYFYLWRLTKDQRFRDYAWSATQAIARHCKTANGFSGIRNTSDIESAKDDVQQTFFLAETLKYLYLIFSSDDLIPLSEWVFNTEAHPFPILSSI